MTEPHAHHDHGHGHDHGGDHGGDHGDFDWVALADRLELDAAITEPIVRQVLGDLDGPAQHVLDVGCGPGAVAATLATALPGAHVTALDTSAELLRRVHRTARQAGVGERVHTVLGDLEHDLPPMAAADLVWAGMVVHHVSDPVATLRRLHDALAPGGTLVMIEFGDPPRVLPDGDPLLVDGTWQRFQAATAWALAGRLGLDPVTVDWPTHLGAAGFVDVVDAMRVAVHSAPLSHTAQAWLVPHLERGVEMAADVMAGDDATRILTLAESVATRPDLAVVAARRVLLARRSAATTDPA